MLCRFLPPAVLLAALLIAGCGGSSESENTKAERFLTDPVDAPIAGLVSENGRATSETDGSTTLVFDDGQRRLGIVVPAGTQLPATLTFGTTPGLRAGASIATTTLAPIGWSADSGTVRVSRSGDRILAEIDAAFVPGPGNTSLVIEISPGFRVTGTGRAE